MVANLPYYITSPVLRHFLEAEAKPEAMVVMVQKEVAEAIAAKPGDMSLLSVSVQFYGEPRIITIVPAESFYPAPKIDSAILKIDIYPEPKVDVDEKGFFDTVRAGFAAPRKQLANSLAKGLGREKSAVLPFLQKARYRPVKAGGDAEHRGVGRSGGSWGRNMLTVKAPAKINLTLEVLGERPDGFHNIRSVIQAINLCDSLGFSLSDKIEVSSDNPDFIAEKSLVATAAARLQQVKGCCPGSQDRGRETHPAVCGAGWGQQRCRRRPAGA